MKPFSTIENPFAEQKNRNPDDAELVGKILGADAEAAMRRTVEGLPSVALAKEGEVGDGLTLTPEEQAQLEKNRKERHERELRETERHTQAQTLFDKGWGEAQGFKTFADYIATIPEVPPKPEQWKDRFDRLILVDGRIPLTKACALAGLKFDGDDNTFVPHDPTKAQSGVRWMYCHDGRKNNNRKANDCRADFLKTKDEIGLDAMEGVSLYVHDPTVIDKHFVDLPASVRADGRDSCASLGHWDGGPRLDWLERLGRLRCGSASRGEWGA